MRISEFKKNIIANYASQGFTVLSSILTLPKLMALMGSDAYGLIGFFSLMQSWIMLLDLGISPTLTREIARFNGGAISSYDLLFFYRKIKNIFVFIAIVFTVFLLLTSHFIATSWLKSNLSYKTLLYSICIMSLILALRWISSIMKAVLIGFEKLVMLSSINIIFAILRFIVIIWMIIFFGSSPILFFSYQLIISLLELIVLNFFVKTLIPKVTIPQDYKARPLKEIMNFSVIIAFTGAVWIIITQTDKLILSRLMDLSEFGYYSLAVQIASGITLICGPLSSAILPKLTKLIALKQFESFVGIYRQSTRLIVCIASSGSLILIFFTRHLVFSWTGDEITVDKISNYIILYSIGNYFLVIAAFPYYMQYAFGNLKFHLYSNIVFLVVLIPSLFIVVNKYGGLGAGYVWIGLNFLYLFFGVPFVNNHFIKGLNKKWYFNDILKICIPGSLVAYCLSLIDLYSKNRIYLGSIVFLFGLIIFSICIIFSGDLRSLINKKTNTV